MKLLLMYFVIKDLNLHLYLGQADMKSFCRKLRLMEFYSDKPGHNDFSLVKPNSQFTPKRNRDIILDTYCDYLTKLPFNEIVKRNISLLPVTWFIIVNIRKCFLKLSHKIVQKFS